MFGKNGLKTWCDYSPSLREPIIYSSAAISTAQSKWSNGSGYFNGTNHKLGFSASSDFAFGTGDFSISVWVRHVAAAGGGVTKDKLIFGGYNTSPNMIFFLTNDALYPAIWDGTAQRTSSIAVTANTWTHVAFSRVSGTLRIFVNGAQGYAAANTINFSGTAEVYVGGSASDRFFSGHMQDLEVLKGVGRYAAAFSVPTGPTVVSTFPDRRPGSAINGTAKTAAGEAADVVIVRAWDTKTLLASVTPNSDGTWSAAVPPGDVDITAIKSGCAPLCHGPYTVNPA